MKTTKQYQIQVRTTEGTVIETIERVVRAESIGNFNPLFCRYKGDRRCLVKSDAGDVSDPFRAEAHYCESFFIVIK